MTLEFLAITFVIVVTPGTGVIYTVNAGLSRGGRASLIAALGCTLGIVPHMLAAVTGLAALMAASPLLFEGLRVGGVAYLLYLAWATWRDHGSLGIEGQRDGQRAIEIIRTAVLINLLNPKLTLFFYAFLPQFVTGQPDAVPRMLEFSAVFMLVTLVVFAIYGLLAAAVRERILEGPRVLVAIRRVFAIALVGFAARLAFSER